MRTRVFMFSLVAVIYVGFLLSTWQVVHEAKQERDGAILDAAAAVAKARALNDQVKELEARIQKLQATMAQGTPAVAAWYPNPNPKGVASRVYPRGTHLRLTRTLSTDVVVNDYGPKVYTKRDLDISRQVAERLHMVRDGVAQLRVEVLP